MGIWSWSSETTNEKPQTVGGSVWNWNTKTGQAAAPFDAYKEAISRIESSGTPDPYRAMGPITNKEKGSRAYGKYQVMDFNIPSWTKMHFGKTLTPQEFLNNPDAQEKVFEGVFGSYIKQYGGAENAAKVWFGGPGALRNPEAKDVNGKSVEDYGKEFNMNMGTAKSTVSSLSKEDRLSLAPETIWLGAKTIGKVSGMVAKEIGQAIARSGLSAARFASKAGGAERDAISEGYGPMLDWVSRKVAPDAPLAFKDELTRRILGELGDERALGLLGETRGEEIQPLSERINALASKWKDPGSGLLALSKSPELTGLERITTEALGSLLQENPKFASGISVMGMVAADLWPGAPSRAAKLRKLSELVAKSIDPAEIERVLIKYGFEKELAKSMTSAGVAMKTPKEAFAWLRVMDGANEALRKAPKVKPSLKPKESEVKTEPPAKRPREASPAKAVIEKPIEPTTPKFSPVRIVGEEPVRVPTERTAFVGTRLFTGNVAGREAFTDSFILELDKGAVAGKTVEPLTEGATKHLETHLQSVEKMQEVAPPTQVGKADNTPVVILKVGDKEVLLDAQKYNYLTKKYGDITFRAEAPDKPVAFYSKGRVQGIVMPIRGTLEEGKRFPIAVTKPTTARPKPQTVPKSRERPAPTQEATRPSRKGRGSPKPPDGQSSTPSKGEYHPINEVATEKMKAIEEPKAKSRMAQFAERMQEAWTRTREVFQDETVRMHALKDIGGVLNRYIRAPGILTHKLNVMRDRLNELTARISSHVETIGGELPQFRKDLNKYMVALHAPERNAIHGDGAAGMTTAEAADIVKEATPEVKEFAEEIKQMNREILEIAHDSGLITDDTYDLLATKYKNYVPLNRVLDEEDFNIAFSAIGRDVRATGFQRAKGSEREVSDVLSNTIFNYDQMLLRSEKNRDNLAFYAWAKEHEKEYSDLFTIEHPKAIGKPFGPKFPVPMQTTNDPHVLQMFVEGKKTWVRFADKRLAVAVRGVGRENLAGYLLAIRAYSRYIASMSTRFNPGFAPPNMLRDLQEAVIFLSSQADIETTSAIKLPAHWPSSAKGITDYLRGADTPGSRIYKELLEDGGTTGGFALSTRADVILDVEKSFRLANSKPRQFLNRAIGAVEGMNTVFEDATRLSVYKLAREQGLSRARAAELAKEATVNFNRMGTGGPTMNALYVFSNASIQGIAKMLKAMKNPKLALGVSSTILTSVATVSEYNDKIDPDWRDKVRSWDRMNGLPFVLPPSKEGDFRYFVVPAGWGIKPILAASNVIVDLAKGERRSPEDAMGTILSSIAESYNPLGGTDAISFITPTFLDTPVDIARNKEWTGAKLRPDYDPRMARGEQYFHSLKRTASGRMAIQASGWAVDNGVPLATRFSPEDIHYAISQHVGGAGRFVGDIFDTIGEVAEGDMPKLADSPFLSRFFRSIPEEEIGGRASSGEEMKSIRETAEVQQRGKKRLKEEALDIVDKWEKEKTPPEEKIESLIDFGKTRQDLATKIVEEVENRSLGRNATDVALMGLDVKSGERALWIFHKIQRLETPESKIELLMEYQRKKILTRQVMEQLNQLLANPDIVNQ